MLPKSVDGIPLTVFSLTASEFITDANADAYRLLLQRLERTERDIALALAVDPSRQIGSMSALRVTGVGAADLLLAVRDVTTQTADPAPTMTMMSMAGRDVLVLTPDAGTSTASQFVFSTDGVIFAIRDADPDLAARFIMAMP